MDADQATWPEAEPDVILILVDVVFQEQSSRCDITGQTKVHFARHELLT